MKQSTEQISAAIFCPQSKAHTTEYLASLHTFISQNEYLKPLLDDIRALEETWSIIASERVDIAALSQGPRFLSYLSTWARSGESSQLAATISGILALPLLVVVQITQYIQYLGSRNIKHAEFLQYLRHRGGVQGYCGGLLPAFAISCSKDEFEVIRNAAIAMRLALVIGAYGELGDDGRIPGPVRTTMIYKPINILDF
jgi:hypothetical protein